MGHIYVITNLINNKQYVGQTSISISERFKQHIQDSKRYTDRPLYRAFQKYGINNFRIQELESCDESELSHKEKQWIEKLNTYHCGYNATLGGEGTIIYNHDEILQALNENNFLSDLVEQFKCDPKTIRNIAKENNIKLANKINTSNKISVACYDKKTLEKVQEFSSITEAAKWLIENGYAKTDIKDYKNIRGKISYVISGKRKTAYGFIWKSICALSSAEQNV